MGASNGYARPVDPTGLSTWRAHTNRNPPSSEPGVDYYVPTGTAVRAASSGRVVDTGDSVYPATGRYVTIDLDDGRRVRYLHLLRRSVGVGDRVQWGQVIGLSGASGYGSDFFGEPYRNDAFWRNTGGDHVHMSLFRNHSYSFGRYATLDPEPYMSSNQGDGGSPATIINPEEDDMKLLYVTDSVDGNDIPGWALLNPRTGKVLPLRTDVAGAQDNANSWARAWGDAKIVTRQDMLNAIDAIQKTS